MVSINKIRTAIRIKFALPDASGRTQSKIVGIPHNTMIRLSARLDRAAITHEIAEELTDSELMVKLYPSIVHNNRSKRAPNIEHIMTELTKPRGKGSTKAVLYLEYVADDPKTAMSRSHFYRNINKVLKRSKLVMKQLHAAGEAVFIDYAGYQVFYRKSNKKVWVKVFVAVAGASKKIFAWATHGEKTQHWIDGMTRMFIFYGGVFEVVEMDNAKALVTKPGLIPVFTKNVKALEEHYGCFMDTSRPRSPQDKSHAELGVKFVTQRILVPMMRNHTFFSLEEINDYLTKEVAVLNNTPFQGLTISRNDLFEKNEKTVLNPLPTTPYQMVVDWLRQKVLPNYHVKYLKHEYSVPYEYRGMQVELVADQTHLSVFHEHKLIACHQIKNEPMGSTTLLEHMPVEHLYEHQSMDKDVNMAWAKGAGQAIENMVAQWYQQTTNPMSRYMGKRCKALRKLCDKHGDEVVNEACEYADRHGMTTPGDIALVISAYGDKESFDALPTLNINHQNIRGAAYYGGRHEA